MRLTHRRLGELISKYCNDNTIKSIIATGNKKTVQNMLTQVKKDLRAIDNDMNAHSCIDIYTYRKYARWYDIDTAYLNMKDAVSLLEHTLNKMNAKTVNVR